MANSINAFKQVNTSQLLAGWRSFQETSSQLKETEFQSHLACCLSTPTAFDSSVGDGHSRNLELSQLGNKGASATALSRERDLDCAGQEVVMGVHFLSTSVFPGIQATVSLDNA